MCSEGVQPGDEGVCDREGARRDGGGWDGQNFDVVAYRATGTSVVKVSEEVNTLLDDHIVLTQQFSFSPYKGPFEERISTGSASCASCRR